jgi:hypothetical protein
LFFVKKSNQIEFFLKKFKPNRNRVKLTGFGSVRFLGQKPVQTGLARFFWFWLGFFWFWLGFSVWLGFFPGFFPVRFGFFSFLLIKLKPNRPVFSNFNRFNRVFFGSVFSVIFFPVFSV